MSKFKYRVKRIHVGRRYRWFIQAAYKGLDEWIVVTNMEAKVPTFSAKADALKTAELLEARA